MGYEEDVKSIQEIINMIKKHSKNGSIKFMCAELIDKVEDLKKYMEVKNEK